MSYDRSQVRKEKKGKKKDGGGQQSTRRRKHYSDLIPFRKLARMLKSSGAEFVARKAFEGAVLGSDDIRGILGSLVQYPDYAVYGSEVQKRAKEALARLDDLDKAAAPKKESESAADCAMDEGMDELDRLTRPDKK